VRTGASFGKVKNRTLKDRRVQHAAQYCGVELTERKSEKRFLDSVGIMGLGPWLCPIDDGWEKSAGSGVAEAV
jgi:hypothetical protein